MDIFYKDIPKLDLHGYSKEDIIYPISQFIDDNIKLKINKIIIVHGKGQGILKKEIRLIFSKDKRVNKLYGDPFNLGITIFELNI